MAALTRSTVKVWVSKYEFKKAKNNLERNL